MGRSIPDARALFHCALDVQEQVASADTQTLDVLRRQLGQVWREEVVALFKQSRFDEALATGRGWLEVERRQKGSQPLRFALALDTLGTIHAHFGQDNLSEHFLARALAIRMEHTDETSPARQQSMYRCLSSTCSLDLSTQGWLTLSSWPRLVDL